MGAGVGVTPIRAALQSIIHYRFKRDLGIFYIHDLSTLGTFLFWHIIVPYGLRYCTISVDLQFISCIIINGRK